MVSPTASGITKLLLGFPVKRYTLKTNNQREHNFIWSFASMGHGFEKMI